MGSCLTLYKHALSHPVLTLPRLDAVGQTLWTLVVGSQKFGVMLGPARKDLGISDLLRAGVNQTLSGTLALLLLPCTL